MIREPILGRSGQISGNFTVQGANVWRCSCAPAPCRPTSPKSSRRTVGYGLSADSIAASKIAAVVGTVWSCSP